MNKKFSSVLIGILAVSLISAIGSYAIFSTTFTVSPSIVLDNATQELGEVFDGLVEGNPITISNDAPSERTITFSEETECDIETSYASTLELNKKDSLWDIIPSTTIVLGYTIVGEEFRYKVDAGLNDLTDYVIIYYPDIDGNPGSWNIENAVEIGDVETNWTLSDTGYLPDVVDCNDAAKLWIIPKADWTTESWNPDDWYFEDNLITYGEDVTIDANSSIVVIPLYDIGVGVTGECTIETTVA